MHLNLIAARTSIYPKEPKTLGEHMLKRRMDTKQTQVQIAELLGVGEKT